MKSLHLHRGLAVLAFTVTLLSGCTPDTDRSAEPTGTDMSASESIENIESAKRVTVSILNELAGLAPEDSRLPKESQPPEPGSIPLRLIPCDDPHQFIYPGATAVYFHDQTSAQAFYKTANNHLRSQGGWLEKSSPGADGEREPKFVSDNGFVVTVRYSEYRGKHMVGIIAFSPCFEMPEDFNYNVEQV